jgi:hypothetical protein
MPGGKRLADILALNDRTVPLDRAVLHTKPSEEEYGPSAVYAAILARQFGLSVDDVSGMTAYLRDPFDSTDQRRKYVTQFTTELTNGCWLRAQDELGPLGRGRHRHEQLLRLYAYCWNVTWELYEHSIQAGLSDRNLQNFIGWRCQLAQAHKVLGATLPSEWPKRIRRNTGRYRTYRCISLCEHVCESSVELQICDYLRNRRIPHTKNEHYPDGSPWSCDWVIRGVKDICGETLWIEYFGLNTAAYNQRCQDKMTYMRERARELLPIFPGNWREQLEQGLRTFGVLG